MSFVVLPILERMENFYRKPVGPDRFPIYLKMLQGDAKDDLVLPIAAYNPMGKAAVLQRISTLREMQAERIMGNTLTQLNEQFPLAEKVSVALNLADDLGGAWSQYALTAYSSRFDNRALVRRAFCTPMLWMSETITEELIAQRTKEYAIRTFYQLNHTWPQNLREWWAQEAFVYQSCFGAELFVLPEQQDFLTANAEADSYNQLFAFFLGDQAAGNMSYPTYDQPGFRHLYPD